MSADSDTFLTCLRKVSKRTTHRGIPLCTPLRLRQRSLRCATRRTSIATAQLNSNIRIVEALTSTKITANLTSKRLHPGRNKNGAVKKNPSVTADAVPPPFRQGRLLRVVEALTSTKLTANLTSKCQHAGRNKNGAKQKRAKQNRLTDVSLFALFQFNNGDT